MRCTRCSRCSNACARSRASARPCRPAAFAAAARRSAISTSSSPHEIRWPSPTRSSAMARSRACSRSKTKSSVVLASGLQVDLRVVDADAFGAALVYFTGSKAHNIALRRIAQAGGLKISEYGVFRGDERIAGATEASVYAAIGLRRAARVARGSRRDRGRARTRCRHWSSASTCAATCTRIPTRRPAATACVRWPMRHAHAGSRTWPSPTGRRMPAAAAATSTGLPGSSTTSIVSTRRSTIWCCSQGRGGRHSRRW